MSNKQATNDVGHWGSRFGYLMVAAGASIGLGNMWKFPYLAYRGGGGVFLVVYLFVVFVLAKPMVEMETAIGRHGAADTVTVFEKINPKWGFVGWIGNLCTLMINMYYVVVGGWVLRYMCQFIFVGDFGGEPAAFFKNFTSNPVQSVLWAMILLAFVAFMMLFGITNLVEKMAKFIMPALFVLLIICGVYACCINEAALLGLKYYLLPDFSKFNVKVFADAVTQVLFSVGIGWSLFVTLGANLPKQNNLRSDALFVSFADTAAATLGGFVIIPSAFAAGIDVQAGPALIFEVMSGIFINLPFGRVIGSFFFIALIFAVISSLFSFFEINIRTAEIKLGLGRKKATMLLTGIIGVGNILVALGFGPMSNFKLPWLYFGSTASYGLYDWLDCFSAYVLMPLGCILVCWFTSRVWKWKDYEAELTNNGKFGKVSKWDKFCICVMVPLFMVIVILNVFGFIK
ncbi:MAG: sodium-dependent transporter [Oscillospiraceae bacterium]|nr:sodium-dependent transporter [Oscillospiraceae bacterium]